MNAPAKITDETNIIDEHGKPTGAMMDGVSAGNVLEPEDVSDPKPGDIVTEKPTQPFPDDARGDIYSAQREHRKEDEDLSGLTETERKNVERMKFEAAGEGYDPYPNEGEPITEEFKDGSTAADPVHRTPVTRQPGADPDTVTPIGDTGVASDSDLVTITVWGMQEHHSQSDIDAAGGIASFQKQRAADVRLERSATYEASVRQLDQTVQQRNADLDKREARLDARDTGQVTGLPSGVQPETAESNGDLEGQARALVQSMYSGDEDDAASKMTAILASRSGNAMTEEQVEGAVRRVLSESAPAVAPDREIQERLRANEVFANEFSHLDSASGRTAIMGMAEQLRSDPVMQDRPLDERVREAGRRITDDFGFSPAVNPQLPRSAPPAPPADLSERYIRKARQVLPPAAAGAGQLRHQGEPGKDTAPLANNKTYIQQMRVNRGLYTET